MASENEGVYLVDHVALWVPVFILAVAVNLDKLLENGGPASSTLYSIVDRVVIVTVDLAIVFVIRVLGSKDGWADGACKVLNVILVVEGGDVAPTQGLATGLAHEIETPKVVAFAEGVLGTIGLGERKEL